MKRYVTLPSGQRCGLGCYVAGWQACRLLVDQGQGRFHIGPAFDGFGANADETLRALRRGLHDRINRHIPGYGVGRKWEADWYWTVHRLARDLRDRIRVHRIGLGLHEPKLIARIAHRFSEE